ncbi:sushi, nidogen and EGF-like domain-containing protein 1 [Ylistrum balloti]|uniref:sushi, nidogen and EGF-like domain-containing protein 1 n=1 Tax=Ylistrum balloti TaxID=509963 RepID=UPI002905D50C|nr:sushi, nidogen and EGF-like domain-containing protein 1 [Ylistrum balloti]
MAVFILIVSLKLMSAVSGIDFEDMYPSDDQLMGPTLDGSSPVIFFNFPFFNNFYDTIYVNNNGHLTFNSQYWQYIPQSLPLSDNTPLIAVFWMDVDTRSTGQVWYKLSNDSALLSRAKADITAYFDLQTSFQPTSVFTATWLDVPYWQAAGDDRTKRNTFQVVLVTDGSTSFAMFHYQKIEWAGYANNITKAVVGFNAGDTLNSFTVNNSDYTDVINLEQRSNTGVPGKFIFRVDGTTIEAASGSELTKQYCCHDQCSRFLK